MLHFCFSSQNIEIQPRRIYRGAVVLNLGSPIWCQWVQGLTFAVARGRRRAIARRFPDQVIESYQWQWDHAIESNNKNCTQRRWHCVVTDEDYSGDRRQTEQFSCPENEMTWMNDSSHSPSYFRSVCQTGRFWNRLDAFQFISMGKDDLSNLWVTSMVTEWIRLVFQGTNGYSNTKLFNQIISFGLIKVCRLHANI